eukprot:CAMPEP_0171580620 /NCGR_PEP_ID=MMETSP0961-20121227/9133_1 /TAXON_ID=87120 /ORGANISM="Aurantiochytrium limacinum, Strain ATCCMYA-1381" /LENGTH=665 /DNA_ID=CAMNT_0012137305 /DNA_START=120 /DNA_END=2113 /DNA_ORIENTATION=+
MELQTTPISLLDWSKLPKGRAVLGAWALIGTVVSSHAYLRRRILHKNLENSPVKNSNIENGNPSMGLSDDNSDERCSSTSPLLKTQNLNSNNDEVVTSMDEGALGGNQRSCEKTSLRDLLRILSQDSHVLSHGALLLIAIVARLWVSVKVSRKIGSLGSLLAQRKWKELADAQIDYALWTIPGALLNAWVEFVQGLLALSIQKSLLRRIHASFALPGVIGRASQQLDDHDQRAASDTARLAEELATMTQSVFKPVAETTILSATLMRLMGVRPLLMCYLYFALAGSWTRMVTPSLTTQAAQAQQQEGEFRSAHSRLKEYVEEVQFAQGEETEASRLQNRFLRMSRSKMIYSAQRFASNALDGYVVRYMGILAALGMMTPALSNPKEVDDPTEFFLTCLHLLVNLMSAFKDVALAFRAWAATRGLAVRVMELLSMSRLPCASSDLPCDIKKVKSPQQAAGDAAARRQTRERILQGETRGLIQVKDLAIEISGTTILDNFSYQFTQGKSVFVRGRNGAGKTSLNRVLRGIWDPQQGTVTSNVSTSDTMFLTQRPYLLQFASFREQLLYPYMEEHVHDQVLKTALERVGMSRYASDLDLPCNIDALSAGEQQRIACARVIVRKPIFCFADECTGSCTADFEHEFFAYCIQSLGITMVTISHRDVVTSL